MLSRLTCLLALVALTGCDKLLHRGAGADGGADAAVVAAADAGATTAAATSASAAAGDPLRTGGEGDAGVAASGATYVTFAGQTNGKVPFHVAIERSGKTVRAIFDTGTPLRMVGAMSDDTHFWIRSAKVNKGEKPATLSGELKEKSLKATFVDPGGKSQAVASGAADTLAPTFDSEYLGTIGGKFVRMKLSRHLGTLSGIYRYAASPSDLQLDGLVHDDGTFELTEKSGGKVTGKLVGAFAAKGAFVGQWHSADGTRSLNLVAEHGTGYPESATYDDKIAVFPQEKLLEGPRCKTDILFPQIKGGADAKAMKEVNDYLRGEDTKAKTCESPDDPQIPDYETSESYTLQTHAGRFIGVQRSGWSFAGGAHGSGGSVCDVIDTKSVKHFKLATKLSPAGRTKLAAMIVAALQKEHGTTKLTDAGFFEDTITVTDKTDLCLGTGWVEASFDAYEIGPYSLGPQSARFTFAQVKELFVNDEQTEAMFSAKPVKPAKPTK